MVIVRAVNAPMSGCSSGVTGATVTPRDHSVMRGDLISPVEWYAMFRSIAWPEPTSGMAAPA
jgi:hypothetical protein